VPEFLQHKPTKIKSANLDIDVLQYFKMTNHSYRLLRKTNKRCGAFIKSWSSALMSWWSNDGWDDDQGRRRLFDDALIVINNRCWAKEFYHQSCGLAPP